MTKNTLEWRRFMTSVYSPCWSEEEGQSQANMAGLEFWIDANSAVKLMTRFDSVCCEMFVVTCTRRNASWTTTSVSALTPRSLSSSTRSARSIRRSVAAGPRTWCGLVFLVARRFWRGRTGTWISVCLCVVMVDAFHYQTYRVSSYSTFPGLTNLIFIIDCFTQKQVFEPRTAKSQPIWIEFCIHLLLYIHLWADLDRDRRVGGSRPNQNDYLFYL